MQNWKMFSGRIYESRLRGCSLYIRTDAVNCCRSCCNSDGPYKRKLSFRNVCRLNKSFSSQGGWLGVKHNVTLGNVINYSEKVKEHVSSVFVQFVVAAFLVTSASVGVSEPPSCKSNFICIDVVYS